MTDEICCGSSFGTFEEQDKVLMAAWIPRYASNIPARPGL